MTSNDVHAYDAIKLYLNLNGNPNVTQRTHQYNVHYFENDN